MSSMTVPQYGSRKRLDGVGGHLKESKDRACYCAGTLLIELDLVQLR